MAQKDDSRTSFMTTDLSSDPEAFIYQSLYGTALINQDVAILDKYKIVIRRDHTVALEGKVKILGGCSSGHEPAFASYVGAGMLAAAVQGNIFQSPTRSSISVAIRELGTNHIAGVLVIIKNTTQERLNFKIAVENAKKEKIKVRLFVVEDDCFGSKDTATGSLGSAGVILISKIAGALAESGENIDDIIKYCQSVSEKLYTCNAALRSPLPIDECICNNSAGPAGPARLICELGIGLQGEMGKKKIEIQSAQQMIVAMLNSIMSRMDAYSKLSMSNDFPLIVMVNNLGSTTPIEEKIVAMEVVKELKKRGFIIRRIYCGTFITSLDMRGFSVTVLRGDDENLLYTLSAPTSALAWSNTISMDLGGNNTLKIPPAYQNPDDDENDEVIEFGGSFSPRTALVIPAIMNFALEAIISSEKQLNIIDSIARDGDTGTNLSLAARYLQFQLASGKIDRKKPGKILWTISKISETRFPGTLGALYTVGFQAAAKVIMRAGSDINGIVWVAALSAAVNEIKRVSEVRIGDKTMLDSLDGALSNMRSLPDEILSSNPLSVMKAAAEGAELATSKTIYTPDKKLLDDLKMSLAVKYPDAGAQAIATWMRALYEGMKIKMSTN